MATFRRLGRRNKVQLNGEWSVDKTQFSSASKWISPRMPEPGPYACANLFPAPSKLSSQLWSPLKNQNAIHIFRAKFMSQTNFLKKKRLETGRQNLIYDVAMFTFQMRFEYLNTSCSSPETLTEQHQTMFRRLSARLSSLHHSSIASNFGSTIWRDKFVWSWNCFVFKGKNSMIFKTDKASAVQCYNTFPFNAICFIR